MANNTELNTGPFIWGAAQNAAGQPDDTIARTGPDISRETFMDDTFRAFMLLYRSGVWHKGMNADLLDGQHADEFQPICATLTALCALSSYGLVAKTAADTIAAREITVGTGLDIVNGDGVSGNPDITLDLNELTTAAAAALDHLIFVDADDNGTKKTTMANALVAIGAQPLDATLTALAAYNTNGLITQIAADTFAGRTISITGDFATIANGDGVGGNPTITGAADLENIVDVWAVDASGNVSGIGTMASGVHTITPTSGATAQAIAVSANGGENRIVFDRTAIASAGSANFDIPIPTGCAASVNIRLVAVQQGTVTSRWTRISEMGVHNSGGTTSVTGFSESVIDNQDPDGVGPSDTTTVTFSASGANLRLAIGTASVNMYVTITATVTYVKA